MGGTPARAPHAPAGVLRTVTLAGEQLIEVPPVLGDLLPEGGLRRGGVVTLAAGDGVPRATWRSDRGGEAGIGAGATSLALALTAPATQAGAWVAAVELPWLGLVAADQLGAALDRLVLVPRAGDQWPAAAAALLDSMDVLLVAPGRRVRPTAARKLAARARERGAVLLALQPPGVRWPEPPDVHLAVRTVRWDGLEHGAGHLRCRLVEVVATGRRAASRPRRRQVWLPGPDGLIAPVAPVAPGVDDGGSGDGPSGHLVPLAG